MKELDGKVACITGGGSGIGEALALACADAGMDVCVADIEGAESERVAEAVRARGRRALASATDVSKPADLETLAESTWRELGACHLLCNNAGVVLAKPLAEVSDADWQWVFSVNLWGPVNGVRAFLPRMLEQGGEAHIANTASVSGLMALPVLGVYTASKYALVGYSETLRDELAPRGIGVSVLCPGGVKSRILESERNRPQALGGGDPAAAGIDLLAREDERDPEEAMEPSRVADALLDAVRRDEFFVMSHANWKGRFERRSQSLLAAFDRATAR